MCSQFWVLVAMNLLKVLDCWLLLPSWNPVLNDFYNITVAYWFSYFTWCIFLISPSYASSLKLEDVSSLSSVFLSVYTHFVNYLIQSHFRLMSLRLDKPYFIWLTVNYFISLLQIDVLNSHVSSVSVNSITTHLLLGTNTNHPWLFNISLDISVFKIYLRYDLIIFCIITLSHCCQSHEPLCQSSKCSPILLSCNLVSNQQS